MVDGRRIQSASATKIPIADIEFPHTLPNGVPIVITRPLHWDLMQHPHALLVGGTGSGKTTLLKELIGHFITTIPESEIYLATYKPKSEDFSFLKDSPYFGDYKRCQEIFDRFYIRFQQRLDGSDLSRHPLILFFDEWVGFLLSQDKKATENLLNRMGQILMLGRSLRVLVVAAMQRPDAIFFKNGARDNFNLIIAMGNLSGDGSRMVFPSDMLKALLPCHEIGTGYALIGGCKLYRIRVPPMSPTIEGYMQQYFERRSQCEH